MCAKRESQSRPRAINICVTLLFIFNRVWFCTGLEFSYDPNNARGPQHWPALFATACAGSTQSPIALAKQVATSTAFVPLSFQRYGEIPSSSKINNDGHTVKITPSFSSAPVISGGGLPAVYELKQFHFHWGRKATEGSEHTLEGQQYPVELHFVHQKVGTTDTVAGTQSDGFAVLGVFLELSPFDNPIMEPIISAVGSLITANSETTFNFPFRMRDLLPLDVYSFFRYQGGLTTPPCTQAVVWTVFTSTIPVSARQVAALRQIKDEKNALVTYNFRPVQPLNDRILYRNGLILLGDVCFIPIICPLMENILRTLLITLRAFLTIPVPNVFG